MSQGRLLEVVMNKHLENGTITPLIDRCVKLITTALSRLLQQ
jgi:hypothetical protein